MCPAGSREVVDNALSTTMMVLVADRRIELARKIQADVMFLDVEEAGMLVEISVGMSNGVAAHPVKRQCFSPLLTSIDILRMTQRMFKAGLQFFDWLRADADSQQPAGDAALFDEVQFCEMRQDCVGTAKREICPQIRAFADCEMVEHNWCCHGRVFQHD